MRLRSALLLTALVVTAAAGPATATARPAAQVVSLSGVVTTSDGTPVVGATVTVGELQFITDDQGNWSGAVDFAPRLREFVTAPGYVAVGFGEIRMSGPGTFAGALHDTMRTIFDPDADVYLRLPSAPPTIADFLSNTGVSRSQEFPADTTSITVTGMRGERDGHPVVRDDAYLGRPDDSVDQIDVTSKGNEFSAVFPIAHGPGAYRLEINDTTGAAVINVPVFVGIPYTAEPPIWPDDADLIGDGPVTRALDALQQVRADHGLPLYAIDVRLQRVAQDHVDDMLAHNWVCHCWADGSTLLDHVRAVGINPPTLPVPGRANYFTFGVSNAISTAPGAAAIRGLFASPGHRKDLRGPYTHIGIAYGGQVDDGTARLSIMYAIER